MEIIRLEEGCDAVRCGEECDLCRGSLVLHRVSRTEIRQLLCLTRLIASVLMMFLLSAALIMVYLHQGKALDCQHKGDEGDDIGSVHHYQQQVGSPISVHLKAAALNNSTGYLEWGTEDIGNNHIHGFQYDKGDLVVPKDGYYMVYLQITFRTLPDYSCIKPGLRLSYELILFAMNYKDDVTLLTSHDLMDCKMGNQPKSKAINGVFNLNTGDRLKVWVVDPTLIITLVESEVFFGAYLI